MPGGPMGGMAGAPPMGAPGMEEAAEAIQQTSQSDEQAQAIKAEDDAFKEALTNIFGEEATKKFVETGEKPTKPIVNEEPPQ